MCLAAVRDMVENGVTQPRRTFAGRRATIPVQQSVKRAAVVWHPWTARSVWPEQAAQ